jgi:hypothetical protein
VGNGLVLQRELEYGIYQEIQIFYVKVDQGLVLQKTEDSLPQKVESLPLQDAVKLVVS